MRKNYHLVSVKLVNHSVMKSLQVTSIFRTREFEQMELEFFCKPGEEIEWQNYWKTFASDWLTSLNMSSENMRLRDHDEDELSHYSNATTDIEYKFPFGWGGVMGYRKSYRLRLT